MPDLGAQFVEANEEVDFYDPFDNGLIVVTLTKEDVRADFKKVSDVTQETYTARDVASYVTTRDGDGMTPLKTG